MLVRLADLNARCPRRILTFWLLVTLAALPLALRAGEVMTADIGTIPGSQADSVRRLIEANFSGQDPYQLFLVVDAEGRDLSDPEVLRPYLALRDKVAALPEVAHLTDFTQPSRLPLRDEAGRYGVALIGLELDELEAAKAVAATVRALVAAERSASPMAPAMYLTGIAAIVKDIEDFTHRDTRRAELLGLPLSLVILLVAFGAVVAAALPGIVGVLAIVLALAVLYLVGQVMPLSIFAQSVVTMLGLATGIDYALLIVSRFREELTARPVAEAVRVTTLTAGRAVAFSGLVVMIALSALLVPPLPFINSMGLGGMVVLLFSFSLSISFTPALLALLGPRVNWLKVTRGTPGQRSRAFWRRWAERVLRRPGLWALAATLVLLLFSAPVLRMELGFAGASGLGPRSEARLALDGLRAVGMVGALQPLDLVLDFGERGFFHPTSQRELATLSRAAAELSHVSEVISATQVALSPLLLRGYYATLETAMASPLADLVEATVSRDGRYALVRVYPAEGTTPAQGQALADALATLPTTLGLGAQAVLGGDYLGQLEWSRAVYGSFPVTIALIFAATFVLLGIAFRSLLIPLKSIVLNLLTVGAAFGLLTLIFQDGVLAALVGLPAGLGLIETTIPLLVFAVTFGLSMDYEVFLVSRIEEGHRRGLPDREAVVHALTATGGVITSAALIMGVVFAVFVGSSVVQMKAIGFGLAVAVLLDASLVRMMIVPSVMLLAGRWNWWLPRPLSRWLKGIRIAHD